MITTVISVSTLVPATAVFGVEAWIANIIATSVATVPSFHLNRRWTWGTHRRERPAARGPAVLDPGVLRARAVDGDRRHGRLVGRGTCTCRRRCTSARSSPATSAGSACSGWRSSSILDRVLFAHRRCRAPAPGRVSDARPTRRGSARNSRSSNSSSSPKRTITRPSRRDDEESLVAGAGGHDEVRRDAGERRVVLELGPGVAPPAQPVAGVRRARRQHLVDERGAAARPGRASDRVARRAGRTSPTRCALRSAPVGEERLTHGVAVPPGDVEADGPEHLRLEVVERVAAAGRPRASCAGRARRRR